MAVGIKSKKEVILLTTEFINRFLQARKKIGIFHMPTSEEIRSLVKMGECVLNRWDEKSLKDICERERIIFNDRDIIRQELGRIRGIDLGAHPEPKVEKRKRWHYEGKIINFCGSMNYNVNLSAYLFTLDFISGRYVHLFLTNLLNPGDSYNTTRSKLKELTTLVKKSRHIFGKDWHLICYLESLGGYVIESNKREILEEVNKWLFSGKDHGLLYKEIFERELNKFMSGRVKQDTRNYLKYEKVEDFIADKAMWARSGAGDKEYLDNESVGKIHYKGRLYTINKTKWTNAIFSDSKTLAIHMKKKSGAKITVAEKYETGKIRLIAAVGLNAYLQQAFVDQWLNMDENYTTTNYSGDQLNTYYMNRSKSLNTAWQLPKDATNWDYTVSRWEIKVLLQSFRQNARWSGDGLKVMDNIINGMDNWSIYYKKQYLGVSDSGLPSGMFWTAKFNAIINYVRNKTIESLITTISSEYIFDWLVTQGDDVDATVSSLHKVLLDKYGSDMLGIPINTMKYFVSQHESEFLRKMFNKDLCFGYPARVFINVLSQKPLTQLEAPGLERVKTTNSLWGIYLDRLSHGGSGDISAASLCFEQDIIKAAKGNKNILRTISNDPNLGGLGNGLYKSVGKPLFIERLYKEQQEKPILLVKKGWFLKNLARNQWEVEDLWHRCSSYLPKRDYLKRKIPIRMEESQYYQLIGFPEDSRFFYKNANTCYFYNASLAYKGSPLLQWRQLLDKKLPRSGLDEITLNDAKTKQLFDRENGNTTRLKRYTNAALSFLDKVSFGFKEGGLTSMMYSRWAFRDMVNYHERNYRRIDKGHILSILGGIEHYYKLIDRFNNYYKITF